MSTRPPVVRISRRILERYLLDDERPVVATRQHWAKLVEPFATTLVALLAVGAISSTLDASTATLGTVLWVVWFVVAGRAVWRLLEWQHEWFVATDRRILMVYGLVTHKVAMMPLRKVTDMNYGRSIMGRLLGYGQFVLESAGQDQAMRVIGWVPDPDEKYRRLCATIFGPDVVDEDDAPHRRVEEAFHQEVEPDPWEPVYDDAPPELTDRFDPDITYVEVSPPRRRRPPAVDPDPTPPWR